MQISSFQTVYQLYGIDVTPGKLFHSMTLCIAGAMYVRMYQQETQHKQSPIARSIDTSGGVKDTNASRELVRSFAQYDLLSTLYRQQFRDLRTAHTFG